jgi:hypothetical protein
MRLSLIIANIPMTSNTTEIFRGPISQTITSDAFSSSFHALILLLIKQQKPQTNKNQGNLRHLILFPITFFNWFDLRNTRLSGFLILYFSLHHLINVALA